jgi:serine protease
METRELPVLRNSPCFSGLPNTPQAYSFNVTAVPQPAGQHLNYLTIWPSNQQMPGVSTLNNPTATVVANAAIVPADPANGDISVFTYNSTDVLIDVNGYFAAPGQSGYSFYPAAPCRVVDTRNNNGQPFTGELIVNTAASPCAPPAGAKGYVFNATVVPSPTLGYLTLWADPGQRPDASTLNAYDGFVTSNMAIVPNINGSTDAFAGDGVTQLILDISGYFAQ